MKDCSSTTIGNLQFAVAVDCLQTNPREYQSQDETNPTATVSYGENGASFQIEMSGRENDVLSSLESCGRLCGDKP